jgi:hypothetical protein
MPVLFTHQILRRLPPEGKRAEELYEDEQEKEE